MQLFYHFTSVDGGFSKGDFKSLNLADYVGDDKELIELNIKQIKGKFNIQKLCLMEQVHGAKSVVVKDDTIKHKCDSLITAQKDLALGVLVADCIPLLLYDKKRHIISAIHAGRAGVFGEIAKKSLEKMSKEFGSLPKDTVAFVGSCIHQCCYEVDGDVLEESKRRYPKFVKNSHLDIYGILLSQLQTLGVKIIDKSVCTSCSLKHYSYRKNQTTGRNMGIIMLRS